MIPRTRTRTSVGESRPKGLKGFKSKQRLNREGYLVARWEIKTSKGSLREIGRASAGVVKFDYKAMFESSRLDAQTKVLYRLGFIIDKDNYETINMEFVEDFKLVNYNFFYLVNNFRNYDRLRIDGSPAIVQRRKDGTFKKVFREEPEKEREEVKKYIESVRKSGV